ncbi:MAG: SRPBCC family protein [Thermoanaerobaculia bacterium]
MLEAIREGDIPGVQLRRRQRLAISPEEAWAWLSDPGKMGRWLARRAEAEEGAVLLHGEGFRERCRTVEIRPPEVWVIAFERLDSGWPAATRLTLRLRAAPGGCEVDVLQEGFQRLPLSIGLTTWEDYRRRWAQALADLHALTADPSSEPV